MEIQNEQELFQVQSTRFLLALKKLINNLSEMKKEQISTSKLQSLPKYIQCINTFCNSFVHGSPIQSCFLILEKKEFLIHIKNLQLELSKEGILGLQLNLARQYTYLDSIFRLLKKSENTNLIRKDGRSFASYILQIRSSLAFLQLQDNIQKAEQLKQRNSQELQNIQSMKDEAIQIGLAERYTKEKNKKYLEKWFWIFCVFGGLFYLFHFGNPSINFDHITQWGQKKSEQTKETYSLNNHILNFLKNSPSYLAIIWFILFASRRANEANHLSSDYAYKEVFASSYERYQNEIKELKEMEILDKEKEKMIVELNIKLLDSMIGVLSDNPAKSLDTKKTTDELPAKEIINLASEIIKFKGKNT